MEKRIGNVIIQAPGGTASKNSSTYKVSLPSAWIKEMGITESDRQIELSFDGTSITINKRLSLDEFIKARKDDGHKLYLLDYYNNQTLCTKIAADYTDQTLCFENYINNFLRTAFGNNLAPTWEDFQTFLEERCIPRSRAGLREYLETVGVERYEPLDIIQKTKGRMAEDHEVEEYIMAEKEKNPFGGLKLAAQKGLASIDVEALKDKAAEATGILKEKAVEVKDAAVAAKDEIADKITELDRMLQGVVTEYNDAYTIMNDKGVQLFVERTRAVDSISFVESLVNSIANRPKSFDAEFEEIHINRKKFTDSCEFANLELQEARKAATGAGAGLAAGASVAFMAPTAAMWIATTFGTASTGAAISTLSGAAATNAALAWLGGGALAAGGGGMAGGTAFLALAGPVGWSIAGATLLTSILIFTTKKPN